MARRTIAVVDGNSLMHRAFHALPETMTAPDGRPTNAAFGFISMLTKMLTELRPDGVVVAFDAGMPAFRREALEQYKVHRPPTADALKQQFPMVRELLDALAIPVVCLDGWEGDDILGTLARMGEEKDLGILLVTGDRDAFQLVSDHVKVVTTRKGLTDIAVYGPAEVIERYGITPEQVPAYLGLKGDTSDNIPGVPGIGEKTAAKLLQQYGTLEEVLAHAADVGGRVGANLAEHAEAALSSRTVATIACDVPIVLDLEGIVLGCYDPVLLAESFGALRFTSLLDRVRAAMPCVAEAGGATADARRAAGVEQSGTAGRTPVASDQNGPSATPVATARPLTVRTVVRGSDAVDLVRGWIAAPGPWLGVAVGVAGDTLFAEEREIAVAGPDAVAIVAGTEGEALLNELLESGRVAAGDAKALLGQLCPPDEAHACTRTPQAEDAERLFDCGIAAYLLESHRSSYELASLHADYLGVTAPDPSEDDPAVSIAAATSAELVPEFERLLEADGSLGVYRDIEMPLVPVLTRMERLGVGIDIEVLAGLAAEAHEGIDRLRAEIYELAGCEFVVDSPKQLSEVLFTRLGLPPQKKTKTGFSTDASVLAALAPLHPIAAAIVSYRELTKLTSTYLEALPRMLGDDGRLHTSFNQTVAATGRLSSSNPNLQNIPVRTELGRRIRAAFVPALGGDVMVSADYSQIELRILAHLSQDSGLIEAFTSGMDFHMATAARVFSVAPEEVEPFMRARAKAVNFGIVYGQTAHGLADTLKIPNSEAQEMIDRYYAAYPGVRRYLDETVASAHRDGYACTMFGRKRRIPELKSSNFNLRSFGERTAMNHPMQGTAADIIKLAMIEVDRRMQESGTRARMVLQVHDELVFEAPAEEVEQLSTLVRDAMGGVCELAVPLEVTVASGPDWASAK